MTTASGTALPSSLLKSFARVVGPAHVLTGDAAAGYAVDWTGGFTGEAAAVLRPGSAEEVAGLLALCSEAGVAVVPQGGNTGLVGGGVPLHGEVVLSLRRLDRLGPVDPDSRQVTAAAGVTLQQVADAGAGRSSAGPGAGRGGAGPGAGRSSAGKGAGRGSARSGAGRGSAEPGAGPGTGPGPEGGTGLDFGVLIASRGSATVGGAVATNAGGLRVLRYGPMRAQLRGIEAVLSDGTVLTHLAGLIKDNTGYDYPGLLAGSEGTLAVVTAARLQLVPRPAGLVTVIAGVGGPGEAHALARQAVREVPGLLSAEFFGHSGLAILAEHAGVALPLSPPAPGYLLLEAGGPDAAEDLAAVAGDLPVAVGTSAPDRARLWACRERYPEAAGLLGPVLKLDVSVPAAAWTRLAGEVAGTVAAVDTEAVVLAYGHVADGNLHVNVVPAGPADGRHQQAVFELVASLGGSISAEHGIGALKAAWLPLARSAAERALFARIRAAFDPVGVLNPHVLPR